MKTSSTSSAPNLLGTVETQVVFDGDDARPAPTTLQLRSERSHGKERIYTITIETKDALGNLGTATVNVRVTSSKDTPTLR